MAMSLGRCARTPVGGTVWVPVSLLLQPPDGGRRGVSHTATRCNVLEYVEDMVRVERHQADGRPYSTYCVLAALVDRCDAGATAQPPQVTEQQLEAWKIDNAELWQLAVEAAAAREADRMLLSVAEDVRGFGDMLAAIALDGGDATLLRLRVQPLLRSAHVGPALGEMMEECLARSVLCRWERRRGDRAVPAPAAEAERALRAAATAWMRGTGMDRCAGGLTLLGAARGESPWTFEKER